MKSLKAGDQLFWPACIGMAAGIGLTGFATEFAGLSDSVPFGLPAWSLVLPVGSVATTDSMQAGGSRDANGSPVSTLRWESPLVTLSSVMK